jgi:CDP-glycerol glycerophosphotransferase
VPDAYERLLGTLEATGSDLATGKVLRFAGDRRWPVGFLTKTFLRQRLRTHVTRFDWLLLDRMAPNKLWRRSFWDAHRLRFPEGVRHEDIPVVVPAHFMARSVDVLHRPVYLYRDREDGVASITRLRTEPQSLRDRVAAVEYVDAYLAEHGPARSRERYQRSVVGEDLRYHLDVLEECSPACRELFVELACGFLERCVDGVEDELPAIQRLKWQLVRRGRMDELIEVLRFEREQLPRNPKVWRHGRAYGDYPFLDDPRMGIPRSIYRLDTSRRRARHLVSLARPTLVRGDRRGR